MARIYRDAYGVPHVRATTVLDLARGAGRGGGAATGPGSWSGCAAGRPAPPPRCSAPTACRWDRLARRAMLVDTARRAHDATSTRRRRPSSAAYVDGVNAGLHADAPELKTLGIEPQPWPEWMPLATFHAQHLLFAGLGSELWRRRARAVLGDDAALLSHEGPISSGSNAWAVGGGRTAIGTAADRRRPAPDHRVAGRLPADPAGVRRVRRGRLHLRRACPACSTSPMPATSRGRSPTRWPTTRTCTRRRPRRPALDRDHQRCATRDRNRSRSPSPSAGRCSPTA